MKRVAVISMHTSPLAQPGVGDGGGMNQVVAQRCGQALASGERQRTEIGAAGDLSR
jgi:D-inositol-3-phosphate glycosyltransferase